MMDMMTAIPPMQRSMMTTGDAAFWLIIGLLVALLLVATVLWVVGNRRNTQSPSQVKDAGHENEAVLWPQNYESPQIHSRQEEEIPLRR